MLLVPHPHFPPCTSTLHVQAAVAGTGARLELEFVVEGAIDRVRWPAPLGPVRADRLWQHSCFEAFVAAPGGREYLELNFAPSGAWAAYRFADYRRDLQALHLPQPPDVAFEIGSSRAALRASLMLADVLRGLATNGAAPADPSGYLELALTAVIEDDAGGLSYWALSHGPGRPDFHARAGFMARLDLRHAATPTGDLRA